jgi:hypothetical protein
VRIFLHFEARILSKRNSEIKLIFNKKKHEALPISIVARRVATAIVEKELINSQKN